MFALVPKKGNEIEIAKKGEKKRKKWKNIGHRTSFSDEKATAASPPTSGGLRPPPGQGTLFYTCEFIELKGLLLENTKKVQ